MPDVNVNSYFLQGVRPAACARSPANASEPPSRAWCKCCTSSNGDTINQKLAAKGNRLEAMLAGGHGERRDRRGSVPGRAVAVSDRRREDEARRGPGRRDRPTAAAASRISIGASSAAKSSCSITSKPRQCQSGGDDDMMRCLLVVGVYALLRRSDAAGRGASGRARLQRPCRADLQEILRRLPQRRGQGRRAGAGALRRHARRRQSGAVVAAGQGRRQPA